MVQIFTQTFIAKNSVERRSYRRRYKPTGQKRTAHPKSQPLEATEDQNQRAFREEKRKKAVLMYSEEVGRQNAAFIANFLRLQIGDIE